MQMPFTTEQFFKIIGMYNMAFFPGQIIIILIGILLLFLVHTKLSTKNLLIGGFLGLIWLWTGIAYHLAFFTQINKAAYLFGALFVIQGLLFVLETFRNNLEFSFNGKSLDYVAYFFIIFGIVIYPILIYLVEKSFNITITLGLPCPTTIMTFGFLMLTSVKFRKYLLIIPAIWTIIGTSAAFNFGVYPDYMIFISAVTAMVYLIARRNLKKVPVQA